GDIQLACRATPIRASQPVNTLPADLACGAKCRPLRSGPRPVRRGSTAAPISACSAFSSVVRAYAMVRQANNAAIRLMKVCAMARTQDTEKFLDTIGSGLPFFSAIEAPQNPLLGLTGPSLRSIHGGPPSTSLTLKGRSLSVRIWQSIDPATIV